MPPARVQPSSVPEIEPWRERYREEMSCQIVHDSIHCRPGWTLTYLLEVDGAAAGYGSLAVDGPWKDKPTLFEFYVVPERRTRAFDLFEALLGATGVRLMEIQSNDALLAVMLHAYAREIESEKVVFRDGRTTELPANGATLRGVTSDADTRTRMEERRGASEWLLELDGETVCEGGIMFHYNRPYGDIYMEVSEPFRRRGFGSYFVQELKRVCYQIGAVPGARCDPTNIASRRTLQCAGFVPYAHILIGSFLQPAR